jgi:hypothetical protein
MSHRVAPRGWTKYDGLASSSNGGCPLVKENQHKYE